jgi:hypothetical protein
MVTNIGTVRMARMNPRPHRVAHGLVDAVLFRRVNVAFHLGKRAGEDGNHHEIRPGQRLGQRVAYDVFPVAFRSGHGGELVADNLVTLGRGAVDIVEAHRAGQLAVHRQVRHKTQAQPREPPPM